MVQPSLLPDSKLDDVRAAITDAHMQLGALRTLANELLDVLASPSKDRQTSVKKIISRGTETISSLDRLRKTLRPALDDASRVPEGPLPATVLERAWALHSEREPKEERLDGEVRPAEEYPARPGADLVAVLRNLEALAALGVRAEALSDTGTPCEAGLALRVRLSLPGTFVALLGLPSPASAAPAWVTIVANEEAQHLLHRPWAASRHAVFRILTQLANTTVLHELVASTAGEQDPGSEVPTPLETVLLWLATYSDLFRRPATSTGRLLDRHAASGALVPPLLRPHNLGWRELGLAAMDASRRTAEHV